MPKFLSQVHPFLLLLLSLVIVFAHLLGGKVVGITTKIAWPIAALVAVVGAISAWRK